MPARHAALLRGINVGRAKRISMAELRSLFEGLGYENVRTLLNSGNVVFSARRRSIGPAEVARIETALERETGVSARVIVLAAREIDEVVAENPLLAFAGDPSRLFVGVPATPEDYAKLGAILAAPWPGERIALGRRAAYLWCPAGPIDSPLACAVAKALRDGVTTRNWSTTLKLQALASG